MNLSPAFKFSALILCLVFAVAGRAQSSAINPADGNYPNSINASGRDNPNSYPGSFPTPIPPISSEFPPSPWPDSDYLVPPKPSFRVTFFPPTPPTYGAPIADGETSPTFNGLRVVTPETLPDFVNENFYPALGTRLAEASLLGNFPARLDAYLANRTALIDELKEQLHLAEAADPATSERDLRAFAASQTPRIVALEQEAELIRDNLVRGAFLQPSADWNEVRGWRLGALPARNPALAASAEFQVIRAAAFFSKGFSTGQRDLLREIAMALREKLPVSRGRAAPSLPGPGDPFAMFFSPETSRLRLPPKLPPELSAKIGGYNHDKDELKTELHDAVVAQDQASAAKRTRNFAALAESQAPRLTALAERAEEIRRGLAALPKPPPPAAQPDLPPDFLDQLNAYRRDKLALDAEHRARISQVSRTPFIGSPDQPIVERIRQSLSARRDTMKQAEADFQQENADRYAELKQRTARMRQRLDTIAAARIDPATGQPMDAAAFMRVFNAAEQQFEKIGRKEAIYHDYKIAMLLPGLSPEQRRLLFGATLVGLAQPLPAGERLPGARFMPVW